MQVVNYSHLFPTRYAIELEGLKGVVSSETFKEVSHREDSKKQIKKLLEDRYTSGKNKWFFQPLRVRILLWSCNNIHCIPPVPELFCVYYSPSPPFFEPALAVVTLTDDVFCSSDLFGSRFLLVVPLLFAKPLHVHHMSTHDACHHHIMSEF